MLENNKEVINLPVTKEHFQELESAIQASWLKDNDKVSDYITLRSILKEMIKLETIEDYFKVNLKNNELDKELFEYFMTKFSKDCISTILKQYFVFGIKGDEICFEILELYIKLFLKHFERADLNNSYYSLFENMKEIFDPNKHFYRAVYVPKSSDMNIIDKEAIPIKQMTVESYNENIVKRADVKVHFPKDEDNNEESNSNENKLRIHQPVIQHSIKKGQIIELLVDNKKINPTVSHHHNNTSPNILNILDNMNLWNYNDRKVWIKGEVTDVSSSLINYHIPDDPSFKVLKVHSIDYCYNDSMTRNYEYFNSLNEGDIVLCQERGRLLPATVISVERTNYNNMTFSSYNFGFRIFFEEKSIYSQEQLVKLARKFWDKKETVDEKGRKFIGDQQSLDEKHPFNSKKLLKLEDFIDMNNITNVVPERPFTYFIKDFFYPDNLVFFNKKNYDKSYNEIINYIHTKNNVNSNNNNTSEVYEEINDNYNENDDKPEYNYVVGRYRFFNYFYARLVQNFCEYKGIHQIIDYFDINKNRNLNSEVYGIILHIISDITCHLHYNFISSYIAPKFNSLIIAYVNSLQNDCIRNIKKECINSIFKLIKFFQFFYESEDTKKLDVDFFSLEFAIKMIKTPILDKRIAALKNIVEIITIKKKQGSHVRKEISDILSQHNLFNEIFGSNSHIQLINKSKELLEVLASENLLNKEDFDLIWNATTTGESESKTTILNIFKELVSILNSDYKKFLLQNLYSLEPIEMTNEEINLLVELVRISFENEKSTKPIERFVLFFMQSIYKTNDTEKIKCLYKRIFEWVNKIDRVKNFYISYLIEKIKSGKDTPQCFRVLRLFIKNHPLEAKDKEDLIYFTKKDLVYYNRRAREIFRTSNDENIEIDMISHGQNIKFRVNFIQILISIGAWQIDNFNSDYQNSGSLDELVEKDVDPVNFLYEVLIVNGNNKYDSDDFYSFCNNLIKNTEENNKHDDLDENDTNTAEYNYSMVIEKKLIDIFNNRILNQSNIENISELSEEAFHTYTYLFFKINRRKKNLNFEVKDLNGNYDYSNIFLCKYPDQLENFEQLWNIILHSKNFVVMTNGIKILTSLYKNIKTDGTFENGSELLLIRTMEMVNNHQTDSYVIKKCFNILKTIIIDSESSFNSSNYGILSHNTLLKRHIIKIKIINFVNDLIDFTVSVYGNTTILELKRIISIKVKVHTDFLEYSYNNNEYSSSTYKALLSSNNGNTIDELEMNNNTEIKIFMNKVDEKIPQINLVHFVTKDTNEHIELNEVNENNAKIDIIPELLDIFKSWFKEHSINVDGEQQMNKECCAKFMKSVTGTKENIPADSQRVISLFNEYDKERKGYISENDFILFFKNSSINIDKRKIVWDNLKMMGIRNDLKPLKEKFYSHECDDNPELVLELPRRKLAVNDHLFETVFKLIKSDHEEIAKVAYEFICFICTNPRILELFKTNIEKVKELLESSANNIYELSYYLQIIEYFLEECEFGIMRNKQRKLSHENDIKQDQQANLDKKSSNISNISQNNHNIEEIKDIDMPFDYLTDNYLIDEENNIKDIDPFDWMKKFIKAGGISTLLMLTMDKLSNINKIDKENTISEEKLDIEKKLILELFRLVKVFYFTSLNSLNEAYKENSNLVSKSSLELDKDLAKLVLESMNFSQLFNYLIQILNDYISLEYKSKENNSSSFDSNNNKINKNSELIKETFELLSGILAYCDDNELQKIEEQIKNDSHKKLFIKSFTYGLFSSNFEIREKYLVSIQNLIRALKFYSRNNFIVFLFNEFYKIFNEHCDFLKDYNLEEVILNNDISEEFFTIYNYLFELEFNNKYDDIAFDPVDFVLKVIELMKNIIEKKILTIKYSIFLTGFINLISIGAKSSKVIKDNLSQNFEFIALIISNVLFEEDELENIKKKNPNDLIDISKFISSNKKLRDDEQFKSACYKLISILINNNFGNLVKFFSIDIFNYKANKDKNEGKLFKVTKKDDEESDDENDDFVPENYKRVVHKATLPKNQGYVGLHNLGAICYANSVLQQFFMVKPFRYHFLKASDEEPVKKSIDENHFHQLQRMFSYLELSNRQFFNPVYFCYSFKDWDNLPINFLIQNDSQEFISRLIDKMEESIKPSKYKYLFNSTFGGKSCSQVKCTNGCNTVNNRFEDFFTLSLEVKSVNNIYSSFEKYIKEEKIDSFMCETCNKKVTITKKNMLSDLPNILIVHLQRITFNYETFTNEKINSRLEFPKELNLKKFCFEEITKKEKDNTNWENDQVYMRCDQYYEYNLQGVVVHLGSADAGHYYSYINLERDGEDNLPSFDYTNENQFKNWLEFNDKNIRSFNFDTMEEECFGGKQQNNSSSNNYLGIFKSDNIQSAYILFYERKIKSPFKLIIPAEELSLRKEMMKKISNSNSEIEVVKVEEHNQTKINKEYNLMRVYNSEDTKEYENLKKKLLETVFYDDIKKEYFYYESFYEAYKEKSIKKVYLYQILKDNNKLMKQQSISDMSFIDFYSTIIAGLDRSLDDPINFSYIKGTLKDEGHKNTPQVNNLLENKINTDNLKSSLISNISTFLTEILSEHSTKEIQEHFKKVLYALYNIITKDSELMILFLFRIDADFDSYKNLIYHDSPIVVGLFSEFLYKIVSHLLAEYIPRIENKELTYKEIVFNGKIPVMNKLIFPLIDKIIYLFPRIPNRSVLRIGGLIKAINCFINEPSQIIFNYLVLKKKEVPFIFITYLIGKESPYYEDTFEKKNDIWDYVRPTPVNSDIIISFIFKFYNQEGAKEQLTERDTECIKCPAFIKFIMKKENVLFSSIIKQLCYEDSETSYSICSEICKQIDNILYSDETGLLELYKNIMPILDIQDSLQLMRFNLILGYPQVKMDSFFYNYKFPAFGYHNMTVKWSKVNTFKSNLRDKNYCCFMKKLLLYAEKERIFIEVFLEILEHCKTNISLFKYIKDMPVEQPFYKDFIEFGIVLLNTFIKSSKDTSYKVRLQEIADYLNANNYIKVNEPGVLESFNQFTGKYLHGDVKLEEVQHIYTKNDVYIMRIDYYTKITDYTPQMDFSKSASYDGPIKEANKDEDLDLYSGNDNEIKETTDTADIEKPVLEDIEIYSTEGVVAVNSILKPYIEREFLIKYLNSLVIDDNIIRIVNPVKMENYYHTITRIIAFNNHRNDEQVVRISFSPPTERNTPLNEFIPEGDILITVPPQCIKNILQIPKIDPLKEFSFNLDDLKYSIFIKQDDNTSYKLASLGNYGNAYSSYLPNNTGDSKYGAVGNVNPYEFYANDSNEDASEGYGEDFYN